MADSSRFDFCVKCGALSRDGQCQSCGYKDPNFVPVTPISSEAQQQYDKQYQHNQMYGQQYYVQSQYTQQYNQQFQQQNQRFQQQNQQYNQYNQQFQQYNSGNSQYSPYAEPQKKNGGVIAILVLVAVILFLFLSCGVGGVMTLVTSYIVDKYEDMQYGEYDSADDWYGGYAEDEYSENNSTAGDGEYYTELSSAVRDDLSYSLEMTSGYYAPEEYENVLVSIAYPVLSGSVSNLDRINEILEYEFSYYVNYFEETFSATIQQDGYYIILADCYITYMDEKVMSVVFQEQVALQDYTAINFYCLNFDMENGRVLNNTEILDMDEEFAIDFRRRELAENGSESLPDYTDQEILQLLRDEKYLVIFYTPLGMEVGLNLGDVVTYMTYSDYEKYLNRY